jgi:hypothetical protein
VAEAANWFGMNNGSTRVRERSYTEEHARDSMENMLFGLCRCVWVQLLRISAALNGDVTRTAAMV